MQGLKVLEASLTVFEPLQATGADPHGSSQVTKPEVQVAAFGFGASVTICIII